MINIGYDVDVTVSDAERLIKWFDVPEAHIFRRHLMQQIEINQSKVDAAIGESPITDLLNRERAISATLTMKSILKWADDISDAIKLYKEQQKTT